MGVGAARERRRQPNPFSPAPHPVSTTTTALTQSLRPVSVARKPDSRRLAGAPVPAWPGLGVGGGGGDATGSPWARSAARGAWVGARGAGGRAGRAPRGPPGRRMAGAWGAVAAAAGGGGGAQWGRGGLCGERADAVAGAAPPLPCSSLIAAR